MVRPFLGITYSNETESLDRRSLPPLVAAPLRSNFDLNIEEVASETAKDVPQRLPDESLLVSSRAVENSHDLRVRVFLQAREEVSTGANDVPKEREVVVAEIERNVSTTLRHQRDEFSEQPLEAAHEPQAAKDNAYRSRRGSGEAGFASA